MKIIGFAPIYNEMELIEGWYHNISQFCDEVWALYDPRSDDGTTEYLKQLESEGKINLYEQNPKHGDSDRYTRGSREIISFIVDMNRFIHEKIEVGQWFLLMAADERLDPKHKDTIMNYVNIADGNHRDGLIFDLYDMINDHQRINYGILNNVLLNHKKFVKRNRYTHYGVRAHDNEEGIYRPIRINLPFYHFGYIINQERNWWRDIDGLRFMDNVPEDKRYVETILPFKDWRKGI